MINLPEKFPFRYAVVVDGDKDTKTYGKLINLLQKQPIERNMLQVTKGHLESSSDSLPLYNLNLYSYAGAGETPSFWQFYNYGYINSDNFDPRVLFKRFGTDTSTSLLEWFHELLSQPGVEDWAVEDIKSRLGEGRKVYGMYSSLWKMLEGPQYEGVIHTRMSYRDLETFMASLPAVDGVERDKIQLIVCDRWESLFFEEILAIRYAARRCLNCGSLLPFDYQGKYCPSTPENQRCVRERGRKRKRSQLPR